MVTEAEHVVQMIGRVILYIRTMKITIQYSVDAIHRVSYIALIGVAQSASPKSTKRFVEIVKAKVAKGLMPWP